MGSRTVYHWTHRANLDSIVRGGLDPAYFEGRMPAVWVCSRCRIGWALAHVSARHGWSPDDMCLIRTRVNGSTLKRTHMSDVFTSDVVLDVATRGDVKLDLASDWESADPASASTPADDT